MAGLWCTFVSDVCWKDRALSSGSLTEVNVDVNVCWGSVVAAVIVWVTWNDSVTAGKVDGRIVDVDVLVVVVNIVTVSAGNVDVNGGAMRRVITRVEMVVII